MFDLLFKRFSFDAVKFNGQILACMIIIWMIVVGCALISVWKQGWPRNRCIFWSAMIIGLPFLGMLLYLPFSWEGGRGSEGLALPKWRK